MSKRAARCGVSAGSHDCLAAACFTSSLTRDLDSRSHAAQSQPCCHVSCHWSPSARAIKHSTKWARCVLFMTGLSYGPKSRSRRCGFMDELSVWPRSASTPYPITLPVREVPPAASRLMRRNLHAFQRPRHAIRVGPIDQPSCRLLRQRSGWLCGVRRG